MPRMVLRVCASSRRGSYWAWRGKALSRSATSQRTRSPCLAQRVMYTHTRTAIQIFSIFLFCTFASRAMCTLSAQ